MSSLISTWMGDRFGNWDIVDFLLFSPIPISFVISNNALLYLIILHYTSLYFSILYFYYIFLAYISFYFLFFFFLSFSFIYIPSFPAITLSISPSFFSYPFILLILPSHTYFIYILCISISLIWPRRSFRFSLSAFRFSHFAFRFFFFVPGFCHAPDSYSNFFLSLLFYYFITIKSSIILQELSLIT